MPKSRPPLLGGALRFLRFAGGWTEAELAQAIGISPDLISKYEKGRKTLSRERLEELLAVMDVPPEAIDAALYALGLAFLRESPGSPVDPSPAEWRSIHRASAGAGQKAAEATREQLSANARRLRAAQARQEVGELWELLGRLPAKRRRAAVEEESRYWTWAVAERLCEESVRAAAHQADQAAELTRLALRVAELAPGSEAWRSRLQGYAWAFVANARRVLGDLPGAEEAFVQSDRLWVAGEPADLGVLDGSRVFDLKGSLRQYQGRFEDALDLFELAQRAARGVEAVGRILIKKASTLRQMGEYERSLTELRQANSLVEGSRDSRLTWLVQYLLTANLCDMGHPTEAEALLPAVREKAVDLGNELDVIRCLWLEGRVAVGLERREEALPALEQVRRYFTSKQIAYDAALASLEVAVLYLEAGQAGEVKRLAEEMLWIFTAQGVHQEALAALKLFCEAARQESATVELARRVITEMERASRFASGGI
jgi:transcriptional regulator with XRE-family HTH domain